MELFREMDLLFLRWMNQEVANSFLDRFFPLMAAPGYYFVPLGLLAVGLLIRGGMKTRLFLGLMVITLILGDAVIVSQLKVVVNRPRPHEMVEGVRLVKQDGVTISHPTERPSKGRSFPSGHVCNNVALAVMAVAFFGRKWGWLYGWALLMAWNRVYVGSHYPSDVLGSWILAMGYSTAILLVFRYAMKRRGMSLDGGS